MKTYRTFLNHILRKVYRFSRISRSEGGIVSGWIVAMLSVECARTVHESLRCAHYQCILQSMLDLLCHSFFIWHIMLLVNTLIVLHLTCSYSKIKIYWDWLLNVNCRFPVYIFSTVAWFPISSLLMGIFWPISIETIF